MAGFFMAAIGPGTPPVPSGEQEYLGGNGFFAVPANVYALEWQAWGPGGSGGYGNNDDVEGGGGGGGGGAWARNVIAVTPGDLIQWTVGVGGAARSQAYGADGFDGTDTTCGGFIIGAGKGGKSAAWSSTPQQAGGDGGVAPTGVTEALAGSPGLPGTKGAGNRSAGKGGNGANGGLGGMAQAVGTDAGVTFPYGNGEPGGAPGAGGGGALGGGTGTGAGAAGKILFKWGPDTTL